MLRVEVNGPVHTRNPLSLKRLDLEGVARRLRGAGMGQIPNSSRRLDAHISRALNKIRKPSTAEEITELLNCELDSEDRPFQAKEVAERLQNSQNAVLTLYWSRGRVRK